ncbi:MAG: hypothetical protein IJW00_03865 [Clostridia bacterium]|nr:hypothetical protein [Clostridia bacterium]
MKHTIRQKPWARLTCGALMLSLLLTTSASVLTAAAGAGNPMVSLPAVTVTHDDRDYDWVKADTETFTYDFTKIEITDYSRDEHLATASLRTNMIFDGQTLSCVEGKTFSFGSAIFLGDDYGIKGGEMSVDANVTSGKLSVGLRLSRSATDPDHRGIWFVFDGTERVTVTEPESGLSASVSTEGVASVGKLTFLDKADRIEAYNGDTLLCTVTYDAYDGALSVTDAKGNTVGSIDRTAVRAAGYFTLHADSMVGTLDNLSFTHSTLTRTDGEGVTSEIDYTTWVATDDRDRTTPTNVEVREEKQVGLFYFLCQTGDDSEFIKDNTKIFLDSGLDGLKSHLSDTDNSGSYYWAEPYFGYYKNTDEWVFRKHAYQLEAAGVDFIFLDFTNGAYYHEGLTALLDTWLAIREEGGSTPDICVFSAGSYGAVMGSLRGSIFSEEGFKKYGDLFYQYQGKPLTLCGAQDGAGELENWIHDTFTVRNCWAWKDEDGGWNWLQEYRERNGTFRYVSGGPGRDLNGNFEQLALCVGHHPTTSKGRSYLNTQFPEIQNEDFGFSLDSGAGLGFAFQFEAVKHYDPNMVLITGWNEWIAGLNHSSSGYETFAGVADPGYQFVDQFNTEYSRDAEPMRLRDGSTVGFGDNFYYQMASYIREFKGTGKVTEAGGQSSINLGDASTWDNVTPAYGDNVGDTAWRSETGYFSNLTYVNSTGRNDLVSAKVSQDAQYLYFMVETAEDIVMDDGSAWMNLFVDLDNDPATGWEGFDLVLNRARDSHYVSVESLAEGWDGRQIGQALYTVEGNRMVIRLAKSVVGISGTAATFSFKWADNATQDGQVMEFMELGDTAPNDRYAYLYICPEGQGTDAVATDAYVLLTADGDSEPARNEAEPLPGTARPEDDTAPDTSVGTPDAGASGTDVTESAPNGGADAEIYVYPTYLKVLIIVTGAVLGLCAYAAIALPTLIKKKRS